MEEVVGFHEDSKIIMEKLTGRTKELDVISIFGMAGLGKTTLATKVYNNPSIVGRFDVRVWCAVSQAYTVRNLLVKILKQITRRTDEVNGEADVLADKVRKRLKNRRYLIVLDDMWAVEAWEDLRLSFPKDENGSRVMVTTRIEEVANQLKHCSDPYSLRFLTEEESWELLKKRVFQGDDSYSSDLLEAGLQVAKHCKGLPLVIVLIAGTISKMERKASLWLEVANDLSSHILGEQSMKAIQSSYDHLEGHLKPPLLYMAYYFPEDYNILASDLLEWWMAEEIVHNMQEEAAKGCMNELVSRSLVMVPKRSNKTGDIKSCMLHDVVREFCLEKLAKENFRQHILPYDPSTPSDYSKERGRTIRFIHKDLFMTSDKVDWMDSIIKEKESDDHRFGQSLELVLPPISYHPPRIVELRLINVLQLDTMTSSSSLIEALKLTDHLRYLEIRVDDHFDFEWVSHLCHLQVLKVHLKSFGVPIRCSVAPFWKLTKLTHVHILCFSFIWEENDIVNFNNSSGAPLLLENLKIVSGYYMTSLDMKLPFWDRFPNLEKFNFKTDKDAFGEGVYSFPILKDNVHLQSLLINHSIPKDSPIWRQRKEYCFLPFSLKNVILGEVILSEDMLSVIASLPNLENLSLNDFFFSHEPFCWDTGDNKFPALKCLKLKMYMLSEWCCSEENFPVLERLVFGSCLSLKEIPDTFADIPTLKLIKVVYCNKSLEESALKIKKQVEENTGCDSLQVLIVDSGEEDTESEEENWFPQCFCFFNIIRKLLCL